MHADAHRRTQMHVDKRRCMRTDADAHGRMQTHVNAKKFWGLYILSIFRVAWVHNLALNCTTESIWQDQGNILTF